jgi:hypothetical protein
MPSRRPLSEAELAAAASFRDEVLLADDDKASYACGGIIPSSLVQVEDLVLYYSDPTNQDGGDSSGQVSYVIS